MLRIRLYSIGAFAALFALIILLPAPTQAQSFSVLHNFTNGPDGALPWAGVTLDSAGNLYGTTLFGGMTSACAGYGCGVVFKVSRRNSSWTFAPLYTFTGGSDGAVPAARVVFGPNGTLYGSTLTGGPGGYPNGTGVIFNLQPPPHASGRVSNPWNETPLYQFGGVADGNNPTGDLLFDAAGNIYGTTESGGYECEDTVYCGTVFELLRNGSSWTESLLYAFTYGPVSLPDSGVIFDQSGNLFGTTVNGVGGIFELAHSGSSWTETIIHQFGRQGDGLGPAGGLLLDPSGTFYGATGGGGSNGAGALYQVIPLAGGWQETVIFNLTSSGPSATLVKDSAGNYYGASCGGGVDHSGAVIKLTPSGGSWIETVLYEFTGGADGYCPKGVTLDASGNLYGTTYAGGTYGYGVVFQITP